MTSIHVITSKNKQQYADLMNAYFRKRHDVFVGERGWATLCKPDGLEIDQYDNDHAIYLLAIDGEKLVGGQRLYPTVQPHMLSDVFYDLVERQLPRHSQIFEWTRYFVIRERRLGRTDCRLLASIQQFCLEENIMQLTAVVEMWWLPRWHQSGFKVKPLGIPQIIEGQPTLAVSIDVSEESLACVLRVGGLKPTQLVRDMLNSDDLEDGARCGLIISQQKLRACSRRFSPRCWRYSHRKRTRGARNFAPSCILLDR